MGRSIGEKIHEYLTTGSITELEALRAQIPPGVRELMAVPGLGPKKAMVLYEELGVASVDELAAAVAEDRVAGLKGFGAKTQDNIVRGLEQMASSGGRVQVAVALDLAEAMLAELQELRGVRRAAYAGSLRRMQETIGDVDLLVASDRAAPIMDRFTSLPTVARVLAHGDTKSSVITTAGLQVDLRVIPLEVWGAAMIYFTGSKGHNVRIREMAVRKGLKLNEYGIFKAKDGHPPRGRDRGGRLRASGAALHPADAARGPRRDRGRARGDAPGPAHRTADARRPPHAHRPHRRRGVTRAMVAAAAELKYAYYAITDHAPNLSMQRMTDEKILAQRAQIARLQSRYPKMRLLHGTELNIDPDGGVDWDEDFLAGFDVNVASVHSHFTMSKEEQTRRVIRAIEHPCVHVIGHLTGRRIGSRAPIELDLEAVFAAAATDRHRARDQLSSGPARPQGRAHPVGEAARGEVRRVDRRALHRAPRPAAVRGGHRSAGLADQGRRDQRLAPDEAAAVPAQGPARLSRRRLPRGFFERPAVDVAPELLGRVLVRRLPDGTRLAGRIVEVEAYEPGDPASHGFRGPTPRNASMFGPPGRLYVYFTYGHHWMMNVVTRPEGEGSAVLLRAIEPTEGAGLMRATRGRSDLRDLCSGPGKLTQALAVDRAQDGEDLVRGSVVWLEAGAPVPPERIAAGGRVGVSVGVEEAWRFVVAGDPFVSRGRVGPPSPKARRSPPSTR